MFDLKKYQRNYQRIWKKENPEKISKYKKIQRIKIRGKLDKIKLENGCSKCGYKKSSRALDFHHINSKTKKFTIGACIINYKFQTLLQEIDKCIVLCSNCHRELGDNI